MVDGKLLRGISNVRKKSVQTDLLEFLPKADQDNQIVKKGE